MSWEPGQPLVSIGEYKDLVRYVDPSFTDIDAETTGPGQVLITVRPTMETMDDSVDRLRDMIETWRMINVVFDIRVLP